MVDGASFAVRAQTRRRLLLLAQRQFDATAFRAHSAAGTSLKPHNVLAVAVTVDMLTTIVTPPVSRPFDLIATCAERIRDRFSAKVSALSPVAREALQECLDCASFPYLCFDLFWYFLLRDVGLPALERRAASPISLQSPGMHHYTQFLAIPEATARSLLTNVFLAAVGDGTGRQLTVGELSALSRKIDMDLPADSWQHLLEEAGLGTADGHSSVCLEEFLLLLGVQFLEDVRPDVVKSALDVVHQRSSVLFIWIVSPARLSLQTRDLITIIFAHSVAHVVTMFMQSACDECVWNRLLAGSLEARVSEWFSGVGTMSADTRKAAPVKVGEAPPPEEAPQKLMGTVSVMIGAMRRLGVGKPTAGATAPQAAAAEIRQLLLALRSPRAQRPEQHASDTGAASPASPHPPATSRGAAAPGHSAAAAATGLLLHPKPPAASPRSVVGTFMTEVRRPVSASLRKGAMDLRGRTEACQAVLATTGSRHVLRTTDANATYALSVRPTQAAAEILRRGSSARGGGDHHQYKTTQLANVPLILTATAERTIAKHARRLQQRFTKQAELQAKEAHRVTSSLLAKYEELMAAYERGRRSGGLTVSHRKLREQQAAIDEVLGSPLVVHVAEAGRAMLVNASTSLGLLGKQLLRQERFAEAHGEVL